MLLIGQTKLSGHLVKLNHLARSGRKAVKMAYTKGSMRKRLLARIKAGTKGGKAGQWSARKAQLLAKKYKAAGGGYK